MCCSRCLFFFARANLIDISNWWGKIQGTSLDIGGYSVRLFNEPYYFIVNNWTGLQLWFETTKNLNKKIIQLQKENKQYNQLRVAFSNQKKELNYLRHIVHVLPDVSRSTGIVRVVGMSSNMLCQNLLVSASDTTILQKNQVVYNPEGLIGRIMELGKYHARVMLITHIQSRVPIQAVNQDWQGILYGQGGNTMRIEIDNDRNDKTTIVSPKVGCVVVTSGIGGIYPKGLVAAKVVAVKKNIILAEPLLQAHKVNYALVINPIT